MNSRMGPRLGFLGVLSLLLLFPALCFSEAAASPTEETVPGASSTGRRIDWQARSDEGYGHLASGDLEAALASFDQALSLNPRAAAAKAGKGMVLARQGELDEAERLLRESLLLNPDPCRSYYELGLIGQKRGDHQQAASDFKAGIEKCRDNGTGG